MRVLVVDDDPGITRTLTDILNIVGHEVVVASSGQEALDKLEDAAPHCVLTDVRMPGMSGVELCRILNREAPSLPVIVMTAYGRDGVVEPTIQQCAVAAVSKPLDMNRLLEVLDRVCPQEGASQDRDGDR